MDPGLDLPTPLSLSLLPSLLCTYSRGSLGEICFFITAYLRVFLALPMVYRNGGGSGSSALWREMGRQGEGCPLLALRGMVDTAT